MSSWWTREIVDAGKFPLMLTFVSFIVTFLVTRTITRLIRSGRGPFRNNVSSSGVHVHHAVPGLVLLVAGAFISVGSEAFAWSCAAAVMIGIGVSLVLDEFALILHLQDVYWTDEGQTSVGVVSLAAAALGFALVGYSPFGISDVDSTELRVRLTGIAIVLVNVLLVVGCVRKAKYATAVIGLFVPVVSAIGVVRLARPDSRWAQRHYDAAKTERARVRHADLDRRYGPIARGFADFIAGRPSLPDPPPAPIPRPRPRHDRSYRSARSGCRSLLPSRPGGRLSTTPLPSRSPLPGARCTLAANAAIVRVRVSRASRPAPSPRLGLTRTRWSPG